MCWNHVRQDTGPSQSIALARHAPAQALALAARGDVNKEIRDLHRRSGIGVCCQPEIDPVEDLTALPLS